MVQDTPANIISSDLAFLDHLTDGICLIDSMHTIYVVNDALTQILAKSAFVMVGKKAEDIFDCGQGAKETSSRLCHLLASITEHGFDLVSAQDVSYMTASGVHRELNVSIAPFPFPLPPPSQLPAPLPPLAILTFHDLTEQRQQERIKTDFIIAAAHQLRTPLTSLKMSIGLLAQSTEDATNPLHARLLKNAEISTMRMERLTNALIELTNIQSGRVRLQSGPVSVHQIIAQGVQLQRERLEKKRQQIYEKLPEENLNVQTDAQSISRVLGHLIANASKFSAAGAPIEVRVEPDERGVVFSVKDEGIGIPPDEQAEIFETFYQSMVVENGTEAGSGLGLPLVRALVELNGGQIWCESTPGKGSTFFVRLPEATKALKM